MIRNVKHYARVPAELGGGPMPVETAEDFERWWQMLARVIEDRTGRTVELKTDKRKPAAYINHNRWVADCPECNGGIDCSPDLPKGCCLDCGLVYVLDFPSKREREEAEAVLSERRQPANRNWDRHKGEKVDRLKTENRLLEPRGRA